MQRDIPDSKRVFQTAAWIWLVYLLSMAIIDSFIYANRPFLPILWYHFFNIIPALIFLGLSHLRWIDTRMNIFAAVMILIITVTPVLVNYWSGVHLPPAPLSNIEGTVLRQLPILLIGLILVAWHYNLTTMILYSLGTNLFEIALVIGLGLMVDTRLSAFYFITSIRTVCFVVVGIYINQLITYLRSQQESLKIANRQLTHYASTLESLTVSRERNHMSRELHDTVVHTLSGLSVQLEAIKAYWDVDANTSRNLLDQSLETTRSGLLETRRALKALRASPLDDLGLINALRTLIDAAAKRGNLHLDISLPDQNIALSPDVEQCIYRITQEAVENVLHHANAQQLTVHLTVRTDEILLMIKDDGIGFNPKTSLPSGHFGLKGMQERAQLVGGALTIHSVPSAGTTIQLVLKGAFRI